MSDIPEEFLVGLPPLPRPPDPPPKSSKKAARERQKKAKAKRDARLVPKPGTPPPKTRGAKPARLPVPTPPPELADALILPADPEPEPYDFSHLAVGDTTHERQQAELVMGMVAELAARKRETLRLYEPLPVQDDFHRSAVRTRLLRGGNRSGKTTSAAIEVARAVTNQDPHGKYPRQGDVFIVGKDWPHMGDVIYKTLFLPGAIKIIFDLQTRRWRAYRPFDPDDLARRHEARAAPPLIPKRLVKSVAWYMKKTSIPRKVVLTNGWTLHFWSGEGTPPQGSQVDIAWLDEEIRNRGWVPEMSARLADRDGKMIWSATPQNGTDQFFELSQQADAERGSPAAVVVEFLPSLLSNPHISQKAKQQLEQSYTDEAERLVRIHGEFSLSAKKIYPEYNRNLHGFAWEGEVPDTWTRYAVVDPGYQVCGVLFAACPDPAEGQPFDVLLYDELYLQACNAQKFGEAFQRKVEGQRFEAFLIDMHGARVHDVGSGKTVIDQYVAELVKRNVRSARTASGFAPGNDDLKGGIERVRQYLAAGNAARPRLRVVADRTEHGLLQPRLSNFDYEILRYRYKKIDELVTDEPDERGRVHLMACVRYLCQYGPRFVYGSRGHEELSPAYAAFLKDRRDRERSEGRVTVFGPASHLPLTG